MNSFVHFIIGAFGNVSAILLFLVPVITFKRIVQKRSTEQFSGIPYVMILLNCLLSACMSSTIKNKGGGTTTADDGSIVFGQTTNEKVTGKEKKTGNIKGLNSSKSV